jgi:hypothetical protein
MLENMPGTNVGDVTRQAIEDLFEGRNDRDYARLMMEESLEKLKVEWALLGLASSFTITATEDGFRIVMVSNKSFSDTRPEVVESEETVDPVSEDLDEDDFGFEDD